MIQMFLLVVQVLRRCRMVLFVAAGLGAWPCPAATFFVSTDGSDSNSGTNLTEPFQSLHRATQVVSAGDVCLIRGGVYRETLAPQHSGTAAMPITFAPYEKEVVTISGSEVVTGWRYVSNGIYAAEVNWDLGNGFNQVFVDGAMVHQARQPGFGNGDLLHPATASVTISGSQGQQITSPAWDGKPDNFWAGAWFCGGVGDRWSWQSARVVSSHGNSITVDPATKSSPWFTGNGSGFVWGLAAMLNEDNEWHLGSSGGRKLLYVRLAGRSNPAQHLVEMKRRNWCIDINSRNHVRVSGLEFRGGAVYLHGSGNILEGCRGMFLSHFLRFPFGYAFDGGRLPGGGVVIQGHHNLVQGCLLFDTAGSGIISRGAENTITRNLIYNTDYSGTYACCIRLEGRSDLVSLNTAYSSGRDILQPAGTAHSITLNDLSGSGQMCRDVGVIYIWGANARDASGKNTRITRNWIHDNASPGPGPLVYLDNWCRNFIVDHNVCWNSPNDSGIRVNAPAAGHQIYHNTLFNCDSIATHTYDMWPDNNPDSSFWTGDFFQYSSWDNLFLGTTPQSQLLDWRHHDFRRRIDLVHAPKVVSPGNGSASRLSDLGAYQHATPFWKAGVNGWLQPKLQVIPAPDGTVTLTAAPGAAFFNVLSTTSLHPPIIWTLVTNTPSVSTTQWVLTIPDPGPEPRFYRLQAR